MTDKKNSTEVATVDKGLATSSPLGIATDQMIAEAQRLVDSKLLPDTVTKAEQALVIIQAGKELGFPPMASFQNIYVVNGRPSLSGQGVGALLRRSGIKYNTVKDLAEVVGADKKVVDRITTIKFTMPDGHEESVSFKWSDAMRAGIAGGPTWKKYPSEMMFWRCLTKGARRVAPEALLGLYEVGELVDAGLDKTQTISVTPDGEVEVMEAEVVETKI